MKFVAWLCSSQVQPSSGPLATLVLASWLLHGRVALLCRTVCACNIAGESASWLSLTCMHSCWIFFWGRSNGKLGWRWWSKLIPGWRWRWSTTCPCNRILHSWCCRARVYIIDDIYVLLRTFVHAYVSIWLAVTCVYRSLEEGSNQTAQIPNQFGAWLLSDHHNVISTYVRT